MYLDWKELESLIAHCDDNVLLYGPPAVGKTYSACAALERVGLTPIVFGAHEETTASSLEGCDTLVSGSFAWRDGKGIRAWRTGQPLVIDEIDKLSGDALSFALTLLNGDTSRFGHLLPTGETVTPKKGFRVVATSNIADPQELPAALRSRFPLSILVDEIHSSALDSVADPNMRAAMLAIAQRSLQQGAGPDVRTFQALIRSGSRLAKQIGDDRARDIMLRALFGERAAEYADSLSLLK